MKSWTRDSIYGARPWVLIGVGVGLALGMMLWSLSEGLWTLWRSLLCLGGTALCIVGGAILQMRLDYRARSKLRREAPP